MPRLSLGAVQATCCIIHVWIRDAMTSRKCCYGYKVTSRKCCYGYKVTRNKTPKTYTCQYYLPDAGFMKLVNDRRYFVLVLHTELHSNQAVSVGSTTDRNLCKRILIYIQQRCNITQFIYIWKPLYIFRVVPPPIIRSANNCIYSMWYLSNHYCYLPLAAAGSSNRVTKSVPRSKHTPSRL